jgi:flagellar biosynthesis GTPase FlhF
MKTKLQLAAIITSFFAFQMSAQDRTTVSAVNSDISDNLDLTAVSSIFGESQDLNDFERRLNDPKLQISNLDLNNDNRVDYLRVIESVESNTHIVVIQSVLGRDLYQDVATIEIEKNRQNKISIQIVGNSFIYGQNYIYEPQYYSTPQIYASFYTSYYHPYYSTFTWNLYPSFYVAWNPYPVYRYRQNVYGCVNYHNTYNYVNYRRCYRAPVIYTSYSCNSYERRNPEYAFSRRNSNYSNRYDLDQRRYSTNNSSRNEVAYSRNSYYSSRNNANYNNTARDYNQNRTSAPKEVSSERTEPQRNYNQNRENYPQKDYSQRAQPQRENSQNRENNSRENYSQNTPSTPRENNSQRDNSQNRRSSPRENSKQRSESQRNNDYAAKNNNRRI